VKDESYDVVVLGDVLEHLRDPLPALRQAVRKLKPTGVVVTSLPNVAHGDVRMALMNGRFRYAQTGLLDRTHVRFFTLETIRQLLQEAGLVVVETKRVVVPLFQSELGVTRDEVSHHTLDELHVDPEVESYQYVMKSVRDNGTHEFSQLATRVNELSDRVHHQRMRIALFRKALVDNAILLGDNAILQSDNAILQEALAAHDNHVKALEDHVSGLEHNIHVLNESLVEADAKYRALLQRSVPFTTRVYRKLRGSSRESR
jgi:SAM-dependent methyltransferase